MTINLSFMQTLAIISNNYLFYHIYLYMFYLPFLNQKSMKFLMIASALLFLPAKLMPLQCGTGMITNKKHICVEPIYIQGCYQYQSQNVCEECEPGNYSQNEGYQLNKDGGCDVLQFQDRDNKIIGCIIRDSSDPQTCLNCANGYIYKDGKCEVGVRHCIDYSQDNTCRQCKNQYSLVLNQCRYNIQLGCKKEHHDHHTCLECQPPFQLKDYHCHIKNCKSYNDYGCVTCLCGYYLTTNRSCKKYQQGCVRYQRGRCINCMEHYRLKGGICEIEGCVSYEGQHCIKCKSQYINQNGGCKFQNCIDWSNDMCLSCKQGFKSQNGVCKAQQPSQPCF